MLGHSKGVEARSDVVPLASDPSVLLYGSKVQTPETVLAYGASKKNSSAAVLAYGASRTNSSDAVLAYGASKKNSSDAVLAYGASKQNSSDAVLAYGPHGSPKKCCAQSSATNDRRVPSLEVDSAKQLARAAVLAKAKRDAVPLKVGIEQEHLSETMQALDPNLPVKKRPAFADELGLPQISLMRLDPHLPAKKTLPSFLLQESPCFPRFATKAR
jgi:hypothetical protein